MLTRRQAPVRLNSASSTTSRTACRRFAPALAVLAAACLPACEAFEVSSDIPPGLQLQSEMPRVDPLARDPNAPVVVRNGKGEVIAQGVPDRGGDLSGNPPLSALDGTYVIETKRNDGGTDVQRLTYPAGQPVKLRRDRDTGRYVAEAPQPVVQRPQASLEFGVTKLDRPDASFLRRENGGVIHGQAFEQDNRADGHTASIGVDLPLNLGGWISKGTKASLGLRLGYAESTADGSIDELPANGDQFGIFTPGNGVVTGQDLLDITYSSKYRDTFGGVDLRKVYQVYGGMYLDSTVGFTYGRQTIEERLSLSTSLTSTRINHLQDTSSRYFGVPLSTAMWVNPFPDYRDFWLTFGGTLEPRHHDGETDWRVSSNAFSDRTETLKDDGWSLGGGLHVGGYFGDPLNLGRGRFPLTVGLKAGVRWDAYPQVEYQDLNAGNGGATLEHDTGRAVYGTLRGQIRF